MDVNTLYQVMGQSGEEIAGNYENTLQENLSENLCFSVNTGLRLAEWRDLAQSS